MRRIPTVVCLIAVVVSPLHPPVAGLQAQESTSPLISGSDAALAAEPESAERSSLAEVAKTPEGLIRALYDMVSFDAGPEPDWEMFRDVFLEDAILVFSARGDRPMRPMGVDGFIQDWRDFYRDAELADKGFYETVAALEVTEFGGLAHAFVVFEPRIGKAPPERQIRGLDSIELSYDGQRWWVAAITTDFESPDQRIPAGIGDPID